MSYLTKREKVLVLIGPTAVGKTKLSIEIAKAFNCEIISGDSMQIYRGMDIGTAKIKKEEMDGIPHHLIDIKEPHENFSVAEFQELVRRKITEIHARGKIPFIVGGTGLYIQAVLYDYEFPDDSYDPELRQKLMDEVDEKGIEHFYQKLMAVDPVTAKKIHPNNKRRIVRALEVYYTTGETMSAISAKQKKEPIYDCLIIGLTMDREKLYERINARVDQMMDEGLLDEVKRLYEMDLKDVSATQAIGYKELFEYFEGKVSLEEAVENLKRNTRRFAKRQLTWFKNKMTVEWFDVTEGAKQDEIFHKINGFLAGMQGFKANT